MSTVNFSNRLSPKSDNRISDHITEEKSSSVSRDIYVLCDGAIKKPGSPNNSLLINKAHTIPASADRLKQSQSGRKSPSESRKKSKQLAKIDHTPLSLITSGKSLIWLQKLDAKRLAVQWNIPNNIQRNCQDLLLGGEKTEFVLRLYQNIAVGNAEWKTSQRTLEYPIDVLRRKCYINLENSGG